MNQNLTLRRIAQMALGLSLMAFMACAGVALAAYPEKPVTLVVNYPAGGALDLAARALATQLGKQWGKPVVVENKPGASGIIGAENVSRQKPDGYTLLATIDSLVTVNPYIYPGKRFDPDKSLALIGLLGTFDQILLVNPSAGIHDVAGLVKQARRRELNYSSAGAGTPGHLTMESFRLAAKLKMLNIPFNGNAPALNALLGNQVDAGFLVYAGSTLQHIRAGTLVPLAISGHDRDPKLPDIPTVAESGIDGLANFDMQFAFLLMAPKGVDPAVLDAWNKALGRAMATPDVRTQLDALNVRQVEGSRDEAHRWVDKYGANMRRIIRDAAIQVQ